MLGFKLKKNEIHDKQEVNYMLAPQTGKVVSVREIPDEVFSEKILGDGAAIIPSEDDIVSPVDGTVVQVADTGHAFCITSDDGMDILIHIGIDTVNLQGEGFKSFVSEGQKVRAGDLIGRADIKFIEKKGYSTHTVVLITNMSEVDDMQSVVGYAEIGKTRIVSYKKK